MNKLPVVTARTLEHPAILLKQADEFPDLHC
jgi:hypothetical protein